MKAPNSLQLMDQVHAFILACSFETNPAYAKTQERILEDAGLLQINPRELYEMRKVYAQHCAEEMANNNSKG